MDLIVVLFVLYLIYKSITNARRKKRAYERRRQQRPEEPQYEPVDFPQASEYKSLAREDEKRKQGTFIPEKREREAEVIDREDKTAGMEKPVPKGPAPERPAPERPVRAFVEEREGMINPRNRAEVIKGLVYSEVLGPPRYLSPWKSPLKTRR